MRYWYRVNKCYFHSHFGVDRVAVEKFSKSYVYCRDEKSGKLVRLERETAFQKLFRTEKEAIAFRNSRIRDHCDFKVKTHYQQKVPQLLRFILGPVWDCVKYSDKGHIQSYIKRIREYQKEVQVQVEKEFGYDRLSAQDNQRSNSPMRRKAVKKG